MCINCIFTTSVNSCRFVKLPGNSLHKLHHLIDEKGLSAIIYTQVSDVEDEVNGLLTYDRKVKKFEPEFVKQILDQMK